MKPQEFLEYSFSKQQEIDTLQEKLYYVKLDFEKVRKKQQTYSKDLDLNNELINYIKTLPKWLYDELGNFSVEYREDGIVFILDQMYIDGDFLKSEYKYKDPTRVGDILSNFFAARTNYWYSEPYQSYQSKKRKKDSRQSSNIFSKIIIKLH